MQPPLQREVEESMTEGAEVDETLRLGLPAFSGRGSWANRLLLIGGAVCVLALLAVSIWHLVPHQGSGEGRGLGDAQAKTELTPKCRQSLKWIRPNPRPRRKPIQRPKKRSKAKRKKRKRIR